MLIRRTAKHLRAAGGKRMNFVDFNGRLAWLCAAAIRVTFLRWHRLLLRFGQCSKQQRSACRNLAFCQRMSTYQRHKVTCLAFISSTKFSLIALNSERIANWIQGISAKGADAASARIEKIDSGLSAAAEAEPRAKALADEIAAAESWSGRKTELMDEVGNRTKLIGGEQDLTAGLERQQAQLTTAKNQKLITRLNKEVSDLRTKLDDVAGARRASNPAAPS